MPMVQLSNNSLSDFVRQVVFGFQNRCQTNSIRLELDIEDVDTPFSCDTIKTAAASLLEHAIESLPDGGEIEVTLINSEYQWELEVAHCESKETETPETVGLKIYTESEHQMRLEAASLTLGGSVQTWKCPLGGLAHVLIVPKLENGLSGRDLSHNKAA